MHIPLPRTLSLAVATATLVVGAAACGSDDGDDSADTTAASSESSGPVETDAPATSAAPDTTTGSTSSTPEGTDAPSGGGDVDAFCEAEIATEAAFASEDPAAIEAATTALGEAAPEEIAETVDAVLASAEDPESPEFAESYSEMIQFMKDNCGYTDLAVTASDYAFAGIEAEVAAGPAIITFDNTGTEVHELILLRVNDDVTESATDILGLPEEEAFSKVTFRARAFDFPDDTSYTATDLESGRYIAVCFLPEGSTPEMMEEMAAAEAGGTDGSTPEGTEGSTPAEGSGSPDGMGQPHFLLGMVQEFTVA